MCWDYRNIIKDDNRWAEVEREDNEPGTSASGKVILVGVSTANPEIPEFVVQFRTDSPRCNAVFRPEDLKKINTQALAAIRDISGEESAPHLGAGKLLNWYMKANFVVEGGKPVAIEYAIKTCSDDVELRQRIPFTFKDNKIMKNGDIKAISTPDDSFKPTKLYSVPASTRVGPELVDMDAKVTKLFDVKDNGAVFTLKPIEKKSCYATAGWKRDDGFNQGTNMPVMITNPKDSPTTLTSLEGEFFINNTWEKATSTLVGIEYYGNVNYDNNIPLPIEAKSAVSVILFICKNIIGDPPVIDGRKHKSLPDPLKIRATLKDVNDKTVTLTYELVNPALRLVTPLTISSGLDQNKSRLLFFLHVDDVNNEERHYVAIFYEHEEEYFLKISTNNSSSYTMGERQLRKLAYDAKRAQKEEILYEDISIITDSRVIKIYGLVDLKGTKPILWGIKCEIKIGNSSATGAFLLYTAIDKAKADITAKKS